MADGVERRELALAAGDADQQGGHALGDRSQVVLDVGAVLHAAERVAPALVRAAEVALHRELAFAHHDDGMDVGLRPLGDERVERAELGGIETDLGLRGEGPAVIERNRRAAVFVSSAAGGNAERKERQQKHERLCHPGLAYVVRCRRQARVSVSP